jgi:hypothetical protein
MMESGRWWDWTSVSKLASMNLVVLLNLILTVYLSGMVRRVEERGKKERREGTGTKLCERVERKLHIWAYFSLLYFPSFPPPLPLPSLFSPPSLFPSSPISHLSSPYRTDDERSAVTIMIYLNTAFEGGLTNFLATDGQDLESYATQEQTKVPSPLSLSPSLSSSLPHLINITTKRKTKR